LNDEYESCSKKVQGMRANVEETRSKQSAIKQGGRVQEALMRQKATGAIKGIYGRLGDLGAIDKKYDVAVSTAVGAGLDRILVDNIDTAATCLNYLKTNDIGRVNMLAHDQTKK
jgi:structural maintenance of chromosome 4